MSLATALGLLQGVQQLQTAYVAKGAAGFGSRVKFSRTTPGTALFVNQATGLTMAQTSKDAAARAALGSSGTPFASLEEALGTLAAPATLLAYETPRTIYLGPGEYTVGGAVISRSISFHLDDAARITDIVNIESAVGPFPTSTARTRVAFLVEGAQQPSLPAGIDISVSGTSTRPVDVHVENIAGTEINATAAVVGEITLESSDVEIHAAGMTLLARDSTFGALTAISLQASSIQANDCNFNRPLAVTCNGTDECRLYSTRMANPGGTWTGGTLLIDTATDFDWTAGGWTKANPGGVAPVIMV